MNEPIDRWLIAKSLHPNTNVVTYANYMALEQRFAELTAEVAAGDLAVAQADKTIARLITQLARLRKVVESFDYPNMSMEELKERATSPSGDGLLYAMAIDARNALKES